MSFDPPAPAGAFRWAVLRRESLSIMLVGLLLLLAFAADLWLGEGYPIAALYTVPVLVAAYRWPTRAVGVTALTAVALNATGDIIDHTLGAHWPFGIGLIALAFLVVLLTDQRQQAIRQTAVAAEARAARATAEAAELRWREFLESLPDGVVIADADRTIVFANRQAERLFGYPRDALIGRSIAMLVPERLRDRLQLPPAGPAALWPAGDEGDRVLRRQDGADLPVEISVSPVQSGDGALMTSVIHDVTERRRVVEELRRTAAEQARLNEELARSNRELEQFAHIASHDLQEPLRLIASYTQLLARRYKGRLDADADEFIDYAVNGAHRLKELINDLLIYSRVGTRVVSLEPIDSAAVLAQVEADLSLRLAETGGQITHDPLPAVLADRLQLTQLCQNLLSNALKYRGEAAPAIHISAERDGDRWRFAVRDNGIGIDPRFHERIFLPFQRLHTVAEYEGTGIGLAICQKIVQRHGGHIWVESTPGHGSTFYFTLPAVPDDKTRPGDKSPG